jgi:hypothetical protein
MVAILQANRNADLTWTPLLFAATPLIPAVNTLDSAAGPAQLQSALRPWGRRVFYDIGRQAHRRVLEYCSYAATNFGDTARNRAKSTRPERVI